MAWIKIDDAFADHPKVIGLSDKAFRTHIEGLCYSGRYLTDGFIPMIVASRMVNNDMAILVELSNAGLWLEDLPNNGFQIHDYLAHQTSKEQVEEKRKSLRERQKRYRERHATTNNGSNDDDWDNELLTEPEYRIQNTEYIKQNTENKELLPSVKVKSAKLAVETISNKLKDARANGINAWNLSKLVEEEWDKLHNANDIGGCIALTAWYVAELQTRQLSSVEIGRIGQMTKRFGRIALLAIDEAASKDLTDLVSYAYRVAQNMYKERQGK
ncbi:hypothetical protein EB001_02340 [bacterium]|nr:hypothetical protein [bacterium]